MRGGRYRKLTPRPGFLAKIAPMFDIPGDARIYVAGHRGLVGSAIVRRLARASHAESSFCGDRIGLGPEDRAILRRFVEEFDARALALPPQRETPVARMPTDPDAIVDDPDLFLEPT